MSGELLRKIGRNTLVYGASGVLQRIVSFFLIPLYTHYLSPQDYGIIELLDLTSYVVAMFVGLGLGSAVVRIYYDYTEKKDQNEVISTAVLFLVPANLAALILLHAVSGRISLLVFGQTGFRHFLDLVFLSLAFNIIAGVLLSYIRAKQQVVLYASVSVLQLALGLSLNVYLIVGRHLGVLGSLYSGVLTQAAIATALVAVTVYEVKVAFCSAKLQQMLRFGAPLIPAGMSMFVLNFADRFFLRRYSSLSVVGTYALGYKMGMALSALLFSPFYLYWSAYMYEVAKRPDAKTQFARVQDYLTLFLTFGALGLSLFSADAIHIVAAPAYWTAAEIVPLIALSYVFSGLYYYFQLGTALCKRTEFRAYAGATSAVLNIVLNFLLIPRYHAYGAAWATLLSFLALASLSYYFSQRLYAIPYELGKFARIVAVAATIFLCSRLIPVHSTLAGIAIHASLLACFPLVLWAVNLYGQEEKNMIRKVFLSALAMPGVASR